LFFRKFGKMHIEETSIPAVKILTPKLHRDGRGYFFESYRRDQLAALGITDDFVQDNQSLSRDVGTVRGLHFQTPPFAQAKLVRVLAGRVWDVAVDIRRSSPTFGQAVTVELDADSQKMLYIPEGFAHGFCTLEPNSILFYKVTAPYAPQHDRGILWSDPALGLNWPLAGHVPVLSDKDTRQPKLADCPDLFA
jgi:dTDP-4-dehydrorhamnose 3,5-epimerase